MQTKDSKPRKRVLTGWAYSHARYIADVLCDAQMPRDLRTAASFGLTELLTLLGMEQPQPGPTPKAWKAVRQAYIDARRVVEELEANQKAAGGGFDMSLPIMEDLNRRDKIRERFQYSAPGLASQVAEELSELLHHLWCKDNQGPDYAIGGPSDINLNLRRAPVYILRSLKKLQHTRHLIEEFGQGRVLEAVEKKHELILQAQIDINRQIIDRDLRDFIEGAHLRVVLTLDTTGRR
jgi:hypothetical protein